MLGWSIVRSVLMVERPSGECVEVRSLVSRVECVYVSSATRRVC